MRRDARVEAARGHLAHCLDQTLERAGQAVGHGNREQGNADQTDENNDQSTQQQLALLVDQFGLVEFDEDMTNHLRRGWFCVARYRLEQRVTLVLRAQHGRAKGDPAFGFVDHRRSVQRLAKDLAGQRNPAADGNRPAFRTDNDGCLDVGLLDGGLGQPVQALDLPGNDAVFTDLREVTYRGKGLGAQFAFQGLYAAQREIGNQGDGDGGTRQEREQQKSLAEIEASHRASLSASMARRISASSGRLRLSAWATLWLIWTANCPGGIGAGNVLLNARTSSALWRAIWAGVE